MILTDNPKTTKKDLDAIWSGVWNDLDSFEALRSISSDETMRWKLKYAPRGKHLEAGCGMGPYVFYFKKLGFDIRGLDISESTIKKNREVSEDLGLKNDLFMVGDVRNLDIESNSISYYISLGVIEHFAEGPMEALKEAYRVLRPGGIAYISTPNILSLANTEEFIGSLLLPNEIPKRFMRKIFYMLGLKKRKDNGWIERRWRLKTLSNFVSGAGFIVTESANVGLKKTFEGAWRPSRRNWNRLLIKLRPFLFPFLDKLEDSYFSKFGVNNIVMAIKPGKKMHCFFCNNLDSTSKSNLVDFQVPVCNSCVNGHDSEILNFYKRGKRPFFNQRNYFKPKNAEKVVCSFCNSKVKDDFFIPNLGFSEKVCNDCITQNSNSLILRNKHLNYNNYS